MSWSGWARAATAVALAGLIVGCPEPTKVTGPSSIHSIVFMPDTATIAVGAAHTLTATALDASGNTISGVTFFWSSQTSSIATVSTGGSVTGMAVGQAQIAASAQGISGYATVTVVPKPIGSVIVVPSSVTLRISTSFTLTDTIKDISGAVVHATPVWTSNFPDTVQVDQTGLVTARALGTAIITASYGGKSGSATVTVSVVPVKSVVITSTPPSIYIGQTTTLAAVAKDSAGNVLPGRVIRWYSQNAAVATIDSMAGVATGVSTGTAPIIATSEGVTSNPVQVTVSAAPPSTVVLSPSVSQVHVGQNVTLTATVTDATGNIIPNPTVTFTSSNNNIASTTTPPGASALFTAGPNTGTATITGTSGAATGTATIIVSLVGVDSVHVSAPQDTLTVGQAPVTLTATAYDSSGNPITGRPVAWNQSNRNVAMVGPTTGVVTPVGPGTVVIFASISGVQGSLAMVVNSVPVGSVIVVPAVDTLLPLGQVQLSDTVKDANGNVLTGRTVMWNSSAPSIASVSSTGQVIGVSPGSAQIMATSGGVSGSNTTVVLALVQTVIVEPTTSTITTAQTVQYSDTLKDANGNVLTGRFYPVTWSTTPATIPISATGLVTPSGPSDTATNATVTATVSQPTGSRSGTASLTVTLVPVASVVVYPSPDTIWATSPLNTAQLNDSTKDALGNNLPNRPVTWTPTSGGVATVNATGLVTATNTAAGSTSITATAIGGANGSGTVVVLGHTNAVNATYLGLASDTLSATGATPGYLNSTDVQVHVLDSFGTDVTASRTIAWTNTDPTTLQVRFLSTGVYNIVAISQNSPTVTLTFTVTDPGPLTVNSTPNTITIVP